MKADKKQISRLLKTARGQIDGVLKMIEEDKYFLDIITQIMASDAILRKSVKEILYEHISGCVNATFDANSVDEKNKKINELLNIIGKLTT